MSTKRLIKQPWVYDDPVALNQVRFYVQSLIEYIEKHEGKYILSGWSMGGSLACQVAMHFKNTNRILGMLLQAPAIGRSTQMPAVKSMILHSYNDSVIPHAPVAFAAGKLPLFYSMLSYDGTDDHRATDELDMGLGFILSLLEDTLQKEDALTKENGRPLVKDNIRLPVTDISAMTLSQAEHHTQLGTDKHVRKHSSSRETNRKRNMSVKQKEHRRSNSREKIPITSQSTS